MRRTAWGLLALAACSRDLAVPAKRTLQVSQTFVDAAPREQVVLTASGGAAPYRFDFAQGGRLSGDDATISPVPGQPDAAAYRAGSLGSALDVLEVRDAADAVATVRVRVGPRLRVTPALSVSAPGGRVTLVASGGRPPYRFAIAAGPGFDPQPATTLLEGADADERILVVGPLGDHDEGAVVTDATLDPADAGSSASAVAIVKVSGALRLYANAPSEVPPFETVDFLAVGGQPPYTFAFHGGTAPSGATIDPVSGRYVAGPSGAATGPVVDAIVVRDAFDQVSEPWPLAVGAPLRLELPVTNLSPGVAVDLVASGGKPPYTFGFAARGNRSSGAVNAASGTYTPGPNQATGDLLAVVDATGVASVVLSEPARVGYSEIEVGSATGRAIEARLRGDRRPDNDAPRQDVVLGHYDGTLAGGVTALLLPPGLPARVSSGFVAQLNGMFFAADLDGDAHDEVVGLGPAGLVVLEPDVVGNLSIARTDATAAVFRAAPDPVSSSTVTFYTASACSVPAGNGVYRVEFAGSTVPQWTCDVLPPDATSQTARSALGVAAGDFDGDGAVDLAWVSSIGPNASLQVSHRVDGKLGVAQSLALPCSFLVGLPYQADGRLAAYRRLASPGDTKSFLVASLVCPDPGGNRQKLVRVDGGTPASRVPAFSPAGPVDLGRPATGPASVRAASPSAGAPQHVAVFGGGLYDVAGASFDAAGAATVFAALPRPMPSTMQWLALPDVNGDEVPDLLVAGTNRIVRLLYGDGDGRFGLRARVQSVANWGIGDVDGDGLDDLAGTDDSPAMAIGFGGGHQLAWAPARGLPGGSAAIAVGRFGRGPEVVHIEFSGGATWRTRVGADGTLQAPERVSVAGTVAPGRPLRARDFAGGAMDFWTGTSVLGVLLFENPADLLSARWVATPLPSSVAGGSFSVFTCVSYPVGAGTAAFPVEAVALCVDAGRANLRLFRSSLPAGGSAFVNRSGGSGWTELFPGMPAGTGGGEQAAVLGAGTLDDGSAWFVATPGGSDDVRHRWAVRVGPAADPHADPVVTLVDLGTASSAGGRCPQASISCAALAGDLDGVDGQPEILFLGGGKLSVYRPAAGGGATLLRQVGAAGSSIDGLVRLAPGPARDVLVRGADHGVIVRNAGGVDLQ